MIYNTKSLLYLIVPLCKIETDKFVPIPARSHQRDWIFDIYIIENTSSEASRISSPDPLLDEVGIEKNLSYPYCTQCVRSSQLRESSGIKSLDLSRVPKGLGSYHSK